MKLHLSLPTRDLDASVAFYAALLDRRPEKQYGDYALFVAESPGLELALALDQTATAPRGEHFGLAVDSAGEVDAQAARLRDAGYAIDVEREETCCYALQSKVWARDPGGRRWETYVVHAEAEPSGTGAGCCP